MGGGDVEGVRPGVGNFYIVLLYPVHRELHHARVAADAVLLMDHQVPRREVGVGLELFPVGGGLGFGLLPRRGLSLGENGQLGGGVLHAGGEPAAGDDRLARLGEGVELKIHPRPELLLPEEGLEVQTPLLRPRQHHRGVARAQVVGEVGDRRLQADAVGGELLGGDGEEGAGALGVLGGGEGVQIGHRPVAQPGGELLRRAGVHPQLGQKGPVFRQGGDVLIQLPEVVFPPLREPGALAEKDGGVRGQVVGRRGHLGIDEGQIAVHGGKEHAVFQLFHIFVQGGDKAVGPAPAPGPVPLFFECPHQPGQPPGGQMGQHLGGGQDAALLQLPGAALGGRVEQAHGVRFVPEKLHPHRLGMGGGEKVQDAAPEGELPHSLHLVAPAVARRRQGLGQLPQVADRPHFQHPGGPGEAVGRQGALEHGLRRGHQEGHPPLGERPQHLQAALLPLPGDHGGVVEKELPGGKGEDLFPGKGPEVGGHAAALGVVGAEHRHRPPGGLPHGGGHVGPMDGREPGHRRRTGPPVQGGQEESEFRDRAERGEQQLHGHLPDRHRWLWKRRKPPLRGGGGCCEGSISLFGGRVKGKAASVGENVRKDPHQCGSETVEKVAQPLFRDGWRAGGRKRQRPFGQLEIPGGHWPPDIPISTFISPRTCGPRSPRAPRR